MTEKTGLDLDALEEKVKDRWDQPLFLDDALALIQRCAEAANEMLHAGWTNSEEQHARTHDRLVALERVREAAEAMLPDLDDGVITREAETGLRAALAAVPK